MQWSEECFSDFQSDSPCKGARGLRLCQCQFWWKSIKKCDRESAHRRIHRYTDRRKPVFSERELTFTFTFTFAICRRPSVCRLSVCRLSVVCNVRAPYSGDYNFRQCFYAIWYLDHLWPFDKNFTEIVPENPSVAGLNQRGVAKYSDFGPFQDYISETVQGRR